MQTAERKRGNGTCMTAGCGQSQFVIP